MSKMVTGLRTNKEKQPLMTLDGRGSTSNKAKPVAILAREVEEREVRGIQVGVRRWLHLGPTLPKFEKATALLLEMDRAESRAR